MSRPRLSPHLLTQDVPDLASLGEEMLAVDREAGWGMDLLRQRCEAADAFWGAILANETTPEGRLVWVSKMTPISRSKNPPFLPGKPSTSIPDLKAPNVGQWHYSWVHVLQGALVRALVKDHTWLGQSLHQLQMALAGVMGWGHSSLLLEAAKTGSPRPGHEGMEAFFHALVKDPGQALNFLLTPQGMQEQGAGFQPALGLLPPDERREVSLLWLAKTAGAMRGMSIEEVQATLWSRWTQVWPDVKNVAHLHWPWDEEETLVARARFSMDPATHPVVHRRWAMFCRSLDVHFTKERLEKALPDGPPARPHRSPRL